MLYGEGDKSFVRLQEEIIKRANDYTLFAWTGLDDSQKHSGILAQSPAQFAQLNDIALRNASIFNPEATITNRGLRTTKTMGELDGVYVLPLNCVREGKQLGILRISQAARPARFLWHPRTRIRNPPVAARSLFHLCLHDPLSRFIQTARQRPQARLPASARIRRDETLQNHTEKPRQLVG
jgi:hypothetical protein